MTYPLNTILTKGLVSRLYHNKLWFIYYLNLNCVLVNFKLPYNWNIISKRSFTATAVNNKPVLTKNYQTPYNNLWPLSKRVVQLNTNLITLNMFFVFITVNTTPFFKYFRPHAHFKLLFMDHNRKGSFTLNLKKCYMRWKNTHNLLYNLFYYEHKLVIFGNKVFKVDILALSSFFCKTLNTFFKYPLVFHYMRESLYSFNITKLMETVKTFRIETAFVSDLTNNEKMARNLQTCNIYTIGVVACSDSPWTVTYPIPVSANGLFSQYYFIRYIYHIQQSAAHSRYLKLLKI